MDSILINNIIIKNLKYFYFSGKILIVSIIPEEDIIYLANILLPFFSSTPQAFPFSTIILVTSAFYKIYKYNKLYIYIIKIIRQKVNHHIIKLY